MKTEGYTEGRWQEGTWNAPVWSEPVFIEGATTRAGRQMVDPQPRARLLVTAGPTHAESLWVLASLKCNPRQGLEMPQNPVRSSELLWLVLALLGLSLEPIWERARGLLRAR